MPLSWPLTPIERLRPLLGTFVRIRARFDDPSAAVGAVEAAFAEVATVHRLMSFHDPDSDLSRINREAAVRPVAVDPQTRAVLEFALALAAETQGAFDPSVGAAAVLAGALPAPGPADPSSLDGVWRDIALEGPRVRLARPLWIDLGGVAKGYAIDRALAVLRAAGAAQACVAAGGDLALFGPEPEPVRLEAGDTERAPVLALQDGAAASSGAGGDDAPAVHVDGRDRGLLARDRFACVTAPDAMSADALTKVVLALGDLAAPVLARRRAHAYSFTPSQGWRTVA